jgi:hypothetical protein
VNRLGRVWWGLVDQAVVSLGVATVTVDGAASLPAADFGALATALAAFYLMQAVVRGLVSNVYILRFSAEPTIPAGPAANAQSAALLLALAMSAVLAGAAAVTGGGTLAGAAAALAVAAPFLLLQDLRRAILVSAGATRRSAAANALALAGQLTGALALHVTGHVTAPALFLVWGAAAALAVAAVQVPTGSPAHLAGLREWMASSRPYCPLLLTQELSLTGTNQVPLLVVAAISGVGVVGALRAAALLLTPMAVAHQAVGRLIVAEASRVDRSELLRFSVRCQAAFLVAWGAWLVLVAAVPARLLGRLLGENLAGALVALPGMAAFGAAAMLTIGPIAALMVSDRLVTSVVTRLALAPLLVGIPSLVAASGAGVGAIAGGFGAFGACSVVVTNLADWVLLRRPAVAVPARALGVGAGG